MKITSSELFALRDFVESYNSDQIDLTNPEASIRGRTYEQLIQKLIEVNMWDRDNQIFCENNKYSDLKLLQQIAINYFDKNIPVWIDSVKSGTEKLKTLEVSDAEDFAILEMCGIFESKLSDESEKFLNLLKVIAYVNPVNIEKQRDEELQKIETGRKGEKLSSQYIKEKYNIDPTETFLIDDSAGYDINFKIDEKDNYIEVKSSKDSINRAKATLTRNQIQACKNVLELRRENAEYFFHFWSFHENVYNLAIIPASVMIERGISKEIPGANILPEQKINFNVFEEFFNKIHPETFISY